MAHILLLEPDQLLSGLYAEALRRAGHSVEICQAAQAAIYAVEAHCPDVIFMELHLTGHSGIEFLYELRSYPEWQQIPVIIVSQAPPQELQRSFGLLKRQLGVGGYYYKPALRLQQLIRLVDDTVHV